MVNGMYQYITRAEVESYLDNYDIESVESADDAMRKITSVNANLTESRWDEMNKYILSGDVKLVHEDRDCIILRDTGRMIWGNSESEIIRFLKDVYKHAASNIIETDDGGEYIFIYKNDSFKTGELNMIHMIARYARESGSLARGIDKLATEEFGCTQDEWASLTGRNQSTISRNLN